jgi:hypothetical protein
VTKIKYRKVRKNHSEAVPSQLIFVDCETADKNQEKDKNEEIHRLWFGVAKYSVWEKGRLTRTKELVFYSTDEFWDWVEVVARPKSRLWIFAHNVGFDLTVLDLFGAISSGRYQTIKPTEQQGIGEQPKNGKAQLPGIVILDDPPTLLSLVRSDGCKVMILDTLNYWRTSLKALGKSVDLVKLDMPDRSEDFTKWVEYCRRDVEIIELAISRLISWWKTNKLGKFGFTAPSLAMAAFRHLPSTTQILAHQEPDVRALERDSYFGGQLEAYKLGDIDEPVFQYDVASLYPSVMKKERFPVHLRKFNITDKAKLGPPPCNTLVSIAQVYLVSPSETFPVRTKQGVCYMCGDGWVTLAGPELCYAARRGYIFAHRSWSEYCCREIFGDFVDYFWKMKIQGQEEGDIVKRTFAKLLLNSLYGKFGQIGANLVPCHDYQPAIEFGLSTMTNPIDGVVRRFLSFSDIVFEEKRGKELAFSIPAISSFVTAFARQKMRRIRSIAGVGNYFYQSTDSLMVNEHGREHLEKEGLIADGVLGKLNLEASGDSAWIGGLHFYRIGQKLTEGSKKLTAETIDRFRWVEPHFDSLKTVIQRGGRPEIHIKKRLKTRTQEYTKGEVLPDGTIVPFRLDSIDRVRAYSTRSVVQI